MSRLRGRFDIVVVDSDCYVRFTSDPKRSLPPAEIAKCLREYADMIERGIEVSARKVTPPETK